MQAIEPRSHIRFTVEIESRAPLANSAVLRNSGKGGSLVVKSGD
jgi:hypothetical protein